MTSYKAFNLSFFFISLSVTSYLGVSQSEVALQIGFKERINTHQWLDNGHARQMIHR